MTFTPIDQPRAFRDVLLEGWKKADGLRSRPDILRINCYLAQTSPGLIQDMEKIGVRVEVADAKEKSLPGSLRAAQDACRWIMGENNRKARSRTKAVRALCLDAYYDHDFHNRRDFKDYYNLKVRARIQQWRNLPVQEPLLIPAGEMDWDPGPWLSSWESSAAICQTVFCRLFAAY